MIRTPQQKLILRKVGAIALTCSIILLFRASLTLLQIYIIVIQSTIISMIYFLILEVLPLSLMLSFLYTASEGIDSKSLSPSSPLIYKK